MCFDSGCGNYEQLWLTKSLRGTFAGSLKVSVSSEGVHSGAFSGIVPDASRITRALLDRVEDSRETGKLLIPALWCEIPQVRR